MSTKSVITDLVQTLEDGRKGFADAAQKLAEDGHDRLASSFQGFAQQRERFSQELRRAAIDRGIELDEDGSIAGALHRGWIGLKDALTGDDADSILKAAKSGEDHAVKEFEKARDEDLPVELRTTVRQQEASIRETRDEIAGLADS